MTTSVDITLPQIHLTFTNFLWIYTSDIHVNVMIVSLKELLTTPKSKTIVKSSSGKIILSLTAASMKQQWLWRRCAVVAMTAIDGVLFKGTSIHLIGEKSTFPFFGLSDFVYMFLLLFVVHFCMEMHLTTVVQFFDEFQFKNQNIPPW